MKTAVVAISSYVAGFVSCVTLIVGVGILVERTGIGDALEVEVWVRGEIEYEEAINSGETGLPPKGYFIESSGVERVYVLGDLAEGYASRVVQVRGGVTSVCGADGFLCYPALEDISISPID